jgi:hypothetical protein
VDVLNFLYIALDDPFRWDEEEGEYKAHGHVLLCLKNRSDCIICVLKFARTNINDSIGWITILDG